MTFAVTGSYAAVLALLYFLLAARVILYRRGNRISLGDGDDPALLSRIRAHGNLAENLPLALILILMLIAEAQGTPAVWLHLMGLVFLAGRLMHGINFSFGLRRMPLRAGGMVLTMIAIALGAVLTLPI